MTKFFYKWLPIIFGCHCRKKRSFHYQGKQFPICARCTGELVGIFGAISSFYFYKPSFVVLLSLMIPLLLDGFLQLLTKYESKNWKRFITGLLFGYALCCFFIISVIFTYQQGYEMGLEWFHKK